MVEMRPRGGRRNYPQTSPFPWRFLVAAVVVALIGYQVNSSFNLVPKPLSLVKFIYSHFMTVPTTGQSVDGREYQLFEYVTKNAERGRPDEVIAAIDKYCWEEGEFLMNVGDVKGQVLDEVVRKVQPSVAVELGTYMGYGALRIGRLLPDGGRLVSIEKYEENARLAREIISYAGLDDRIEVVVGYVGDGGKTLSLLQANGITSIDVAFFDHSKDAYLPDLQSLEDNKMFHKGSVVVADNILLPGAPEYLSHVRNSEQWRTDIHHLKVEYQNLLPDIVAVSTYFPNES
mmetsp:Transcript_27279/g.76162  ORF Transcript_27279/g.76162 Transcript_27279/m.76162 type:complete len:288 (+) Transcript_27279:142-1005(+)